MGAEEQRGRHDGSGSVVWRRLDIMLGLLYAAPAGALLLHEAGGGLTVVVAVLATIACAGAISIRGRAPLVSLGVLLAALVIVELVVPRAVVVVLLPIALPLATIASRARIVRSSWALLVAALAAVTTALPDFRHVGAVGAFLPLYVASAAIGYAFGVHRRDLERQAAQLRRAAEVERERAELAMARERMLIARELHDVVAHGMSVVTVQAGFAGLVLDQDLQAARTALSAIEDTGRETLAELRQLLTVLRRDAPESVQPELAPAPGLDDLPSLVRGFAAAGLEVRIETTGHPVPLSGGLGLAVYRIVQEALTNVVRHARTSTATIALGYGDTVLDIVVRDGGQGGAVDAAPGHGILGMRERAALYGGSVTTRRLPHGGFEVACRLPLPATTAPVAVARGRTAS